MVWAAFMADATTDASVMVNHCLSVFLKTDGIFGAVHIATACHAPPAEIGYFIIDLYAGRTGFIYYAQDILFSTRFAV